jgi:hypothetical protein
MSAPGPAPATLPSGVVYSPAPPPPPGYGPPPPGWGGWYGGYPASPPGERTRQAVEDLRRAVNWYLVYLVLGLLGALISAAVLGAVSISSAGPLSGSLGAGGSGGLDLSGGDALAVLAVSGLIALAAFIILILSWVTWRTGSKRLAEAAGEYGPEAARAAERGSRDWLYATLIYIFGIVATVVIVFAILFSTIIGNLGSGSNNTTAVTQSIGATVVSLAVVVAVASVLFTLLTYWFATGSLVGGFLPIAPAPLKAVASSARSYILVGAFLSFLSVVGFFLPFGSLLGLLSPLVIVYGFWQLRSAYTTWLAAPPRPGAMPAAPMPSYTPWHP